MMFLAKRVWLALLMMASLWSGASSALTIELALVMDGSGSIRPDDWQKQIQGYRNAFASGTFYDDYVSPSPFNTLYVSAYTFATTVDQAIGWTAIRNNTDASLFGEQFLLIGQPASVSVPPGTPRNIWTNTEGALQAASTGILSNGIDSARRVIDISTDGVPTICDGGVSSSSNGCGPDRTPTSAALAAAVDARNNGVVVNALGVGRGVDSSYLTALVAAGSGLPQAGFFLQANTFDQFGSTLQTKLGREIQGVPEPAVLLLMIAGMMGLLGFRRSQQRPLAT